MFAIMTILISLFLVSCSQKISSDVIGFYFLTDTQEESVIAARHFETKEDAASYYKQENVNKYYVFATKKGNAQQMLNSMEGSRDSDGCIYITLTDFEGTTNPGDSVKAFINKYKLINVPLQ